MFADRFSTSERLRALVASRGSAWSSGRRLISALLVPILLVLTQQAALVHELGHFAQQVQRASSLDPQTHAGDYCEKCFVFGHLSGASAFTPPATLPFVASDECPSAPPALAKVSTPSACRIRGPPVEI